MTKVRCGLVAVGTALVLATGCTGPGPTAESPVSAAAAAPTSAAPPPTELPMLLGSGLVANPVDISTPGPAVFSVRTVVLPPGGTTGWHLHPGTETSIVTDGSITLLREGACDPVRYDVGDAIFIPDAQPHLARNDGPDPAELVVTYLLAPGAADAFDEPAACPAE